MGWCNIDCVWDPSSGCIPIYRSFLTSKMPAAVADNGWIEVLFHEPQDIEIVRLRFGGLLKPFAKNQKGDQQKKDVQFDIDFDHILDNAELRFGVTTAAEAEAKTLSQSSPACKQTYVVDKVAGREIFWRTAKSKPERNVGCILISVLGKQENPIALRGFNIRTSRASVKTFSLDSAKGDDAAHGRPVDAGAAAPAAPAPVGGKHLGIHGVTPMDLWWEEHLAWGLIVSTASASGALAGMLGCTMRVLFRRNGHHVLPT
jgi:hypothetical protein